SANGSVTATKPPLMPYGSTRKKKVAGDETIRDRFVIRGAASSRLATPRLVCERDRDDNAIFEIPCDVTFAGRIFDQVDLTRTHRDFLAVTHLELGPAAESNHVLAHRPHMPVARRAGGSRTELRARRLDHLRRPAV